jgi:hypothetical protein
MQYALSNVKQVRSTPFRRRGRPHDLCRSFRGADHLRLVLEVAQTILDDTLRAVA